MVIMKVCDFCGVVIILSLQMIAVNSAKILSITPAGSISHHYVYRGLFNGLARNGHQIVAVTADPQNAELLHENIEEVDINKYAYRLAEYKEQLPSLLKHRMHPISIYKNMMNERYNKQKEFKSSSPRVKEILENDGKDFDLLFHETYFENLMYFTQKFEAPTIGVATAFLPMESYRNFEMPYNPLFYTDNYATNYDLTSGNGDISFLKKLFVIYTFLKQRRLFELHVKESAENVKTLADIELEDLIRNKTMNFVTMSHLVNGNRPVTEKLKFLGDMSSSRKLLYEDDIAEDLLSKMKNYSEGIIYFSLGTNMKVADIASRELELFKNVFMELNQFLIFWKGDASAMEDKPDNVIISNNFPQYSILKHPNTKLLITHGGRQSLDEALAAEIPVVVIPFLFDQPWHAYHSRKAGLGHVIDVYSVTKEELKDTILEVINNPIYKQNTIRHKQLINDVPQTGLETATYWVEYVQRYKNTKHFDPEPSDFISFFWIDVGIFLIMTVLFKTALFFICYKYVCTYWIVKGFVKDKTK